MLHALVIASVLALLVSDGMWAGKPLPLTPAATCAITLAAIAAIWAGVHLVILTCARRMDRGGGGSLRWIQLADWTLAFGRIAISAAQIAALLGLGLLEAVRSLAGDWPAIDELLALVPLLAGLTLVARSSYPIERRLREATLLRRIDEGEDITHLPGPGRHTLGVLRNQIALVLVPLLLLLTWHDLLHWLYLRTPGDWLERALGPAAAGWTLGAVQLTGAAAIFIAMPAVLRRVWDTVPLGEGPLRDDLLALARRHRVRVREILVWRTDGAMVNAAVLGLAPWLRYILITDSLLERLPREQVDAVMAHEVAHIRRRHLPWLLVCLIASLLLIAVALAPLEGALERLGAAGPAIEGAILLLGAGFIFGLVSRRFEWQADAFAAADLSRAAPSHCPDPRSQCLITDAAATAMSRALAAVAALNHVPPRRFSFRHGSIASRRNRLARLVGRPVDNLGIDRQVRLIKLASLAALAAGIGGLIWLG
jgi:STE24 endopeptidase